MPSLTVAAVDGKCCNTAGTCRSDGRAAKDKETEETIEVGWQAIQEPPARVSC
jgi:hypothetical protein